MHSNARFTSDRDRQLVCHSKRSKGEKRARPWALYAPSLGPFLPELGQRPSAGPWGRRRVRWISRSISLSHSLFFSRSMPRSSSTIILHCRRITAAHDMSLLFPFDPRNLFVVGSPGQSINQISLL
jgi:hypothetical protein